MGMRGKEKKRAHWWSGGSSCFGGPIDQCEMSGMEWERKSVRKRILSRFFGTKQTVPESGDGDVLGDEMMKRISYEKEKNHKGKTKAVMFHENQNSTDQTTKNQSKLTVQHKASKCDYRTEPAPLYKMLDPVRTQTRLSHSDSPTVSPVKENPKRKTLHDLDLTKGIFILSVIIALVLLFGRSFAIVCVSIWLYVVLRLKSDVAEKEKEKENEIKKKNEEEMLDSDEYKQMVVLRGFLERDKKRPVRGK